MTQNEFRRAALALPGAVEASHMNHPDFRVDGRIFASLGAPRAGYGMVKLTPDEQAFFMGSRPGSFEPAAGAWGRQGYTLVRLAAADKPAVRLALKAAHLGASGKQGGRRTGAANRRRKGASTSRTRDTG